MATIDPQGYVQITDRKKDLIKRKGEWISSVDMENLVLANPGVLEAAVVGRPDEICDEVPVVLVVRREPSKHPVEAQDIIDLLATKFAEVAVAQSRRRPLRRGAAQDHRRQARQEGDTQDAGGPLARFAAPGATSQWSTASRVIVESRASIAKSYRTPVHAIDPSTWPDPFVFCGSILTEH